MAVRPLRPANHRRPGEPLPHQLANDTRTPPAALNRFNVMRMSSPHLMGYYSPFPEAISLRKAGCPRVTHPFATLSKLYRSEEFKSKRPVRLACVRHAASVRPEPGSNSQKVFFLKA